MSREIRIRGEVVYVFGFVANAFLAWSSRLVLLLHSVFMTTDTLDVF